MPKIIKKTVKKQAVNEADLSQKKLGKLQVSVYDLSGKAVETMNLPKEIFDVTVNKRLIAQSVRVFLANQRAGSASTKSRGEVRGSTRKIYRQKGTGRARHGGIRAPIFVHGGIAHGPKPKDFSLKMPQKMKKAALFSLLTLKAQSGEIKVVSGLDKIEPKTKIMAELLTSINGKKAQNKMLFVLDTKSDSIIRSVRNIEGVTFEYARQLYAYEVLNSTEIIFVKEAIEEMKKTIPGKKVN